jgi:hypothetical protein
MYLRRGQFRKSWWYTWTAGVRGNYETAITITCQTAKEADLHFNGEFPTYIPLTPLHVSLVPIDTFELRTHHGIYTETLFTVFVCVWEVSSYDRAMANKWFRSAAHRQLHTTIQPQSELWRYWKKSDPTQERRGCLFPPSPFWPLPRRNNQTTQKCTRNWSLISERQNRNGGRSDASSVVW